MNDLLFIPTPQEELKSLWALAADLQYERDRKGDVIKILKRMCEITGKYDFGENYQDQGYRMRCMAELFFHCDEYEEAYTAANASLEFFALQCDDVHVAYVVLLHILKMKIEVFWGRKDDAYKSNQEFILATAKDKYTPTDFWQRDALCLLTKIDDMKNWIHSEELRRKRFTCEICGKFQAQVEYLIHPGNKTHLHVCPDCYLDADKKANSEKYDFE